MCVWGEDRDYRRRNTSFQSSLHYVLASLTCNITDHEMVGRPVVGIGRLVVVVVVLCLLPRINVMPIPVRNVVDTLARNDQPVARAAHVAHADSDFLIIRSRKILFRAVKGPCPVVATRYYPHVHATPCAAPRGHQRDGRNASPRNLYLLVTLNHVRKLRKCFD